MAAPTEGSGIYFDGVSGVANPVTVSLGDAALTLISPQGSMIDRWDYAMLERLRAPDHRLRLAPAKSDARLEVRDRAFAEAAEDRLGMSDTQVARLVRLRRHHVFEWSIAAFAGMVLIGLTGIPAVASLLLPLIPWSVEAKIGASFNGGQSKDFEGPGPFECGDAGPKEQAGKAAFFKMFDRIETAADLPIKLKVTIIRRQIVNAFAQTGGYVYVYKGIIDYTKTPDELAGVLAHELGHVAHRDFFRQFLESAGVSYLLLAVASGTGGGALLASAQKLFVAHNSRAVEAAADAFSGVVMRKLGADPHAMADVFERMIKESKPSRTPLLLYDHPADDKRIAAIRAEPSVPNPKPLLDDADWRALKQVCSEGASTVPGGGSLP